MNTTLPPITRKLQQGAAFIVMLVIMVLGVTAILFGSLSAANLNISRDKITADALAKAKEALISYAVNSSQPGSLPCPDIAGAGRAQTSSDCGQYIGQLPWFTLGLPALRDGNGAPLWYALSRNFRKDSTNNHINSDSIGNLSISGSVNASNLVAIVFAAGPNISGQSRSSTQTALCSTTSSTIAENLCARNYLEGNNANPSPKATPNLQYTLTETSDNFNDHAIYLSSSDIVPKVEQRIGREIKNCLDDYAATSAGKYPWAVPVTSGTYTTTNNTLFGRVPDEPAIVTSSSVNNSNNPNLLNALSALQAAETACQSSDSTNNSNNLANAGQALLDALANLTIPPFTSSFINSARNAANSALQNDMCKSIENGNSNTNSVQTNLNAANNALSSITIDVPQDSSMQIAWPAACILSAPVASYWTDWRTMIFYRVSTPYRPNGSLSCGTNCLSIVGNGNPNAGSGSYRATVIVAGKNLNQTARNQAITANYLEGLNASGATTTTFEAWQTQDQAAHAVNDDVLCLDGKGLDPNSKCY